MLDYGEDSGICFLVMELLEGKPLDVEAKRHVGYMAEVSKLPLQMSAEEMLRHYNETQPSCRFSFAGEGDFSKLDGAMAISAYRIIRVFYPPTWLHNLIDKFFHPPHSLHRISSGSIGKSISIINSFY